jgi:SAM-dependent methyltransferase
MKCELCAGGRFSLLHRKEFADILRCADCGLALSSLVSKGGGEIEDLQKAFFDDRDWVEARDTVEFLFRAEARRRLRLICKYKGGGRLLEVGSGTGEFLAAARRGGFEVTGVEMSRPAAEYARRTYGVEVLSAWLDELRGKSEVYDVITLNHVLEHILVQRESLKVLHDLLAEGGIIHVEVPNLASWGYHLRKGEWAGFSRAHLYFYTPETLSRMFTECGFKVLRVATREGENSWFNLLTGSLAGSLLNNARRWLRAGQANGQGAERTPPRHAGVVLPKGCEAEAPARPRTRERLRTLMRVGYSRAGYVSGLVLKPFLMAEEALNGGGGVWVIATKR